MFLGVINFIPAILSLQRLSSKQAVNIETIFSSPDGTKSGFGRYGSRLATMEVQHPMKRILAISAGLMLATSAAVAAPELMTRVPSDSLTVTDWYKQDVYDTHNDKIGEVKDVLVAPDGKVQSLIVGVGGFLGAGEKDVAVNFDSIKKTKKNDSVYLTMDTTKDALKNAPGFKYDKQKTTWVPDTSSKNTSQ